MIGYTPVVLGQDHTFTIAIDLTTGDEFIGRGGPSSVKDGYFAFVNDDYTYPAH